MICIYHSRDLDGYTSGAIVKEKYPHATMIGYDYGQPLDILAISKGESVIMIDVSLPMPIMGELAERSGNLIWIDHHISAINEYNEFIKTTTNPSWTTYLRDGVAACELAWEFLMETIPPVYITLLGEYDTWRNKDKDRWDNFIMPFQYGMREICTSPETFPWNDLIKHGISPVVQSGKAILKYQQSVNASNCQRNAFEMQFKGLRVIALNGGPFNSGTFDSIYNPDKHDIMMPFQWNGKQWTVSMYTSKDIDCSVIAKSLGGGGHRKACGFQVKETDILEFFRQNAE